MRITNYGKSDMMASYTGHHPLEPLLAAAIARAEAAEDTVSLLSAELHDALAELEDLKEELAAKELRLIDGKMYYVLPWPMGSSGSGGSQEM